MTVNLALQRPLEDYIVYLEHLTRRSVRLLEKMAAPGMRFVDPLHDVTGSAAVMQIYTAMLDERDGMKISVTDAAWGRDGHTVYLRWTRQGKDWRIDGISEVTFDPTGTIVAQVDTWDSGRQAKVSSLTSWLWRKIKNNLFPPS